MISSTAIRWSGGAGQSRGHSLEVRRRLHADKTLRVARKLRAPGDKSQSFFESSHSDFNSLSHPDVLLIVRLICSFGVPAGPAPKMALNTHISRPMPAKHNTMIDLTTPLGPPSSNALFANTSSSTVTLRDTHAYATANQPRFLHLRHHKVPRNQCKASGHSCDLPRTMEFRGGLTALRRSLAPTLAIEGSPRAGHRISTAINWRERLIRWHARLVRACPRWDLWTAVSDRIIVRT